MMIITIFAVAVAIIAVLIAADIDLPSMPNPDGQTVSVTGTYTAKSEPTQATLVIGFENEAETAEKAQKMNSDEMANVLIALRLAGLTDDDFKTLNYNIWDRKSCWDCANPETVYVASHTLEVTTDNVDMMGRYLDIAVDAGANNIHNVRFSVTEEEQAEMKKEVIEKATQDAKDKADALAAGLGLEVYRVIHISDTSWDYGPHRVMYAEIEEAAVTASGVHADTQVIPGDVEISARVNAQFELA